MTSIYPETIGETLDRLDVTASKIGMNSAAACLAFLHDLDAVYARMHELGPDNPSRKTAAAQLETVVAKIRKEGRQFLRDVGGAPALRQARVEGNPPADHVWWYLDQWLDARRREQIKRSLISIGITAVLLVVFGVIYNRYLAPDPQVSARYGHQQQATSLLLTGDFEGALVEIDLGLQVAPQDPELLVMRGVVQDQLGETAQANEDFQAAEKGFGDLETFALSRGDTYRMANQLEKAMADAERAVQINPQSARAYLLRAQVNEAQQKYPEALNDYDTAYKYADVNDEPELAAIARIQRGMLSQKLSMPGSLDNTSTPAP